MIGVEVDLAIVAIEVKVRSVGELANSAQIFVLAHHPAPEENHFAS
ncbi:MAG: hypothetical protein HY980_00050 [Candidatus Magasanikbacteria bacterium]|nr:hypothetical protein [Candidatus Magasanikbacteria bacterium]